MRITTAAAGVFACTVLVGTGAQAQAARHYDCSKPGNANKAACKGAVAPSAPSAVAPPALPASAKAPRRYDCSKAGNANKSACKSASTPAPAPATTPAQNPAPAPSPAKPTIFDRLRARKAPAASPQAAPAAPASAPAAASGASRGKSITTDAAGATGQCRDGTYTHATHHSGACSGHGGVAKWST